MGDVRDQGSKGYGASQHADHDRLDGYELPVRPDKIDRDIAATQHQATEGQRLQDPEAVDNPPHENAAHGETHHRGGVGERSGAPRDGKLGLDRRENDDRRPKAGAAYRSNDQGNQQSPPGVVAVRPSFLRCLSGSDRGQAIPPPTQQFLLLAKRSVTVEPTFRQAAERAGCIAFRTGRGSREVEKGFTAPAA